MIYRLFHHNIHGASRVTLARTQRVAITCLLALIMGSPHVFSQKNSTQGKGPFTTAHVSMDRSGTYPTAVTFPEENQPTVPVFFTEFRKTFAVSRDVELKPVKVDTDNTGEVQRRYQQYYRGVEVCGGEYILQEKNGRVRSAMGKLSPDLNLDPMPLAKEKQSLARALEYVGATKYMWEDSFWENELKQKFPDRDTTYFPKGILCWAPKKFGAVDPAAYRLSYRFDIYSSSPNAARRIIVDARTGSIVADIPLESNCTGASFTSIFNGSRSISTEKYTATNFRLRDDCQAATIRIRDWNSTTTTASPLEIENTTNTWTTMNERFGASVLWETKLAYSYYLGIHGRASYDNANGGIEGYINAIFACTPPPSPCYYPDNASMSFSGGTMKVGLGSSGTLANSWSSLDIIAHEYTHAVTASSSGLVYSNESGALNESFSDIFGEVIENYGLGSNDWLMGDERTSGAIRSMANPKLYGDPDTYLGTNWYSGTGDNGGVHTNSGVQNKWFYLLSQGGSGTNDNGWAYSFTGIGITDARAIAFRNMTVKLTSGATYNDARTGSIAAAADLFGGASVERQKVYKAWRAVGIDPCVLTCPADITTSNTPGLCGKTVTFAATTTSGDCDVVSTLPASGYFFPVGSTVVTSTSTSGQTCSFTVTVEDTELPSITCPADITQNNDPGNCSAVVTFSVGASDNCAGVTVVASPPSGSVFPVGSTIVNCVATDASGNTSDCSFTVTVKDTEPPLIACSSDITQDNEPGQCSAVVTFSTIASDNCPGMVLVSDPPSGSVFHVGVTTVTSTATDAHGNVSSCQFDVTVQDVEPPTIAVTLNPTSLWPPNHSLRTINATVTVTDNCPNPTYVLTSITSNEPDNGLGDGDAPNDIQSAVFGTPDLSYQMRAERSGSGSGRVYTAKYTVTDSSGNTAEDEATVTVPRSSKMPNIGAAPGRYELEQNYPNPFNPTTTLRYGLPEKSVVTLKIYNVLGVEVVTLVHDEVREAGRYDEQFDGSALGAGTYTYRLTAVATESGTEYSDVKKMVLLK